MVQHAYVKAPYFSITYPLFEQLISYSTTKLDEFLFHSIKEVASYLSIKTEIIKTSRIYKNSHLKGEERILNICRQENADTYFNLIGGINLYDKRHFLEHGIGLFFLNPRLVSYRQSKETFVPWLSILDVLMFNDLNKINQLISESDTI